MDDNRIPQSMSAESLSDDRRLTQHKGKPVAIFDFEELSKHEPIVLIKLEEEVYELRRTRTGKLVLHK